MRMTPSPWLKIAEESAEVHRGPFEMIFNLSRRRSMMNKATVVSRFTRGGGITQKAVLALLLIGSLGLAAHAATDPLCGAYEPNDSFQAAAPITSGELVNAAICPAGDQDYYSFALSGAGSLSLALQTAQNFQDNSGTDTGGVVAETSDGTGDQALSLELYDAGFNLVATGAASGGDVVSLSYAAQAGTYYAKVYDPLATDQEGYTLVASWGGGANQVPLTVLAEPQGSGSVSLNPSGQSFPSGTQVTLTAVPGAGSTFGFWSGISGIDPAANPITITLSSPTVIEAHFNSGGDFQAVASLQGIVPASTLSAPTTVTVASGSSATPVVSASYFVDGLVAASSTTSPFAWLLQPGPLGNGTHTLNVFVRNSLGAGTSLTVPFTVETVSAPSITGIKKLGNPLRLKILGTGFVSGSKVTINGTATPHSRYKAKKKTLIAGSGKALKRMLPKKTGVCVRVVNPDGTASACFTFTR